MASQLQTVTTGLAFGESLRWHNGRLWVADWGDRKLLAIDEQGQAEVMVQLDFTSFQSICMDWLPDGRLLIVSSAAGQLLCQQADGSLAPYADLNTLTDKGWNEIICDRRGNTYVNGGGFKFGSGEPFAPGIIALVTPDGKAWQVADGIAFPNGMAITADNSTLIIAESYANKLTAFDIQADGSLTNRRTWADLGNGAPDGICLDSQGAMWYADVPNQCCKRVREGGEILETITLDQGGFDCTLGGTDGKTLYVVTREWGGVDQVDVQQRSGKIVAYPVQVPLQQ